MSDAAVEAVVPVRGLPAGKARLARLLTVEQRNRLVRAMLADVVRALVDDAHRPCEAPG
jgi:2-phospho-L-lactate guanylyltransferase (CobY/MobA/RfbA family)